MSLLPVAAFAVSGEKYCSLFREITKSIFSYSFVTNIYVFITYINNKIGHQRKTCKTVEIFKPHQ